jgi:hypothetical protein
MLSGKPAQNIGHKRFFSTSAVSIASNYIIPPADLPRAFAPARLLTKSYEARPTKSKGGVIVARNTLRDYRRGLLENQRKFDSWLEANAVLGFILFLGIMAMTLAGLNSAGRQDATEVVSSATALR